MKFTYTSTLTIACACLFSTVALASQHDTAPVSGYAESFITDRRLEGAQITILETGQTLSTRQDGRFGPIDWPIGKPITLLFEMAGYHTTQSATVTVPEEGLNDKYHEITFQVPSNAMFDALHHIIGGEADPNMCHVAATVTAFHKTMDDCPQGEADAKLQLIPDMGLDPFYFGVFESGPLKDKTNPFKRGLTFTSPDGGVLLFNLPPSDVPYRITANKEGRLFSVSEFTCIKDRFINLSPPQGPSVIL